MVGKTFIGASLLALLSSVSACSCIAPPPLSECAVRDNEAALLVTVVSKKTFQCNQFDGTAIANVLIKRVFKDNTDLELKQGSVVSVSSNLFGNLCGFDLSTGTQYILFANAPFVPEEEESDDDEVEIVGVADSPKDDDDDVIVKPSRKLRATRTASIQVTAKATDGAQVSARGFTDGTTCDIPNADLSTSLCSGNVVDPQRKHVEALAAGCAALMDEDDTDDDNDD